MQNKDDSIKITNLHELKIEPCPKREAELEEIKSAIYIFTGHAPRGLLFFLHLYRHVVRCDYSKIDEIVPKILFMYEFKQPYLTRNPDIKFEIDKTIDSNIISSELCNIFENTIDHSSIKDVNSFISSLIDCWKDYREHYLTKAKGNNPV